MADLTQWWEDPEQVADRFAAVCDVAERMWQHAPLTDGTGMRHTSDDARSAARRIFEIMGVPLA